MSVKLTLFGLIERLVGNLNTNARFPRRYFTSKATRLSHNFQSYEIKRKGIADTLFLDF